MRVLRPGMHGVVPLAYELRVSGAAYTDHLASVEDVPSYLNRQMADAACAGDRRPRRGRDQAPLIPSHNSRATTPPIEASDGARLKGNLMKYAVLSTTAVAVVTAALCSAQPASAQDFGRMLGRLAERTAERAARNAADELIRPRDDSDAPS